MFAAGALPALLVLLLASARAQEGRAVVREAPAKTEAATPAKRPAARPAARPKPAAKPAPKTKARPKSEPPPLPQITLWKRVGSSLLFYVDGKPEVELGEGTWDEEKDGRIERRKAYGGVSADGRFAWHWVKLESIRKGRVDEVLNWASTLSYYGSSGKALWEDEGAEAPPGREPLVMSDDGETVLVFGRMGSKWRMTAYSFTGNPLTRIELGDRMVDARISSGGRFALIAWGPNDRPLVCSFLDLEKRTRRDVAASTLPPLEQLTLGADGTVRTGLKVVLKVRP